MARPRIKICCIASPAEARLAARAGADLLGLVGPMPTGPGPVTLAEARVIAEGAEPWATPILLTASETAAALEADARAAGVRALQVVRHVAPAELARLRAAAPWLRLVQVIHVEGPEALDLIPAYQPHADAFLLDSGRPSVQELGGTGRVHDWEVSAAFVRRAALPVFLAGGLTPANVAGAIARVRPFGVDLCTGVRTGGALDGAKLSAFMEQAWRS